MSRLRNVYLRASPLAIVNDDLLCTQSKWQNGKKKKMLSHTANAFWIWALSCCSEILHLLWSAIQFCYYFRHCVTFRRFAHFNINERVICRGIYRIANLQFVEYQIFDGFNLLLFFFRTNTNKERRRRLWLAAHANIWKWFLSFAFVAVPVPMPTAPPIPVKERIPLHTGPDPKSIDGRFSVENICCPFCFYIIFFGDQISIFFFFPKINNNLFRTDKLLRIILHGPELNHTFWQKKLDKKSTSGRARYGLGCRHGAFVADDFYSTLLLCFHSPKLHLCDCSEWKCDIRIICFLRRWCFA